jgi:hypothetical protein
MPRIDQPGTATVAPTASSPCARTWRSASLARSASARASPRPAARGCRRARGPGDGTARRGRSRAPRGSPPGSRAQGRDPVSGQGDVLGRAPMPPRVTTPSASSRRAMSSATRLDTVVLFKPVSAAIVARERGPARRCAAARRRGCGGGRGAGWRAPGRARLTLQRRRHSGDGPSWRMDTNRPRPGTRAPRQRAGALAQRRELRPGPGVGDVPRLEPRAPRGRDAVAQQAEVARRVGVRVDEDEDARLGRRRAWSSLRSRRSGAALISSIVPVRAAASIRRSTSTA